MFQQLPDTPLDEVDVRAFTVLLWDEHELAARSAARKIDDALTRAEDTRTPIDLEHHELAAIQLVLRKARLEVDRPSLAQFRLTLEQLLA